MEKAIIGLLIFLIGTIFVEMRNNANGRGKIHKRIDNLDQKFVGKDLCHERSKRVDEIGEDVKELLKRNGGPR